MTPPSTHGAQISLKYSTWALSPSPNAKENDVSLNTKPELQDGGRGIQPANIWDAARLPAFLVLTSEGLPKVTPERFPSITSDEGHGGQSPQEEGRSSPEEARGLQHPGGFLMCDAV